MAKNTSVAHGEMNREEAFKGLEAFIAKLEVEWQRDGVEWVFDFLSLLRVFLLAATEKNLDSGHWRVFAKNCVDLSKNAISSRALNSSPSMPRMFPRNTQSHNFSSAAVA